MKATPAPFPLLGQSGKEEVPPLRKILPSSATPGQIAPQPKHHPSKHKLDPGHLDGAGYQLRVQDAGWVEISRADLGWKTGVGGELGGISSKGGGERSTGKL